MKLLGFFTIERKAIKMLNIFLTNLGKYNEGELIGDWVELPISDEELKEFKKKIGINHYYEEMFITDYECDFGLEVKEYDSLDKLNKIVETYNEMNEYEQKVLNAALQLYDFDEALQKVESGDWTIYEGCDDMTDVAYEVVEECGYLNDVPDTIARYFDYEAFGRDLNFESQYVFMEDGSVVNFYN